MQTHIANGHVVSRHALVELIDLIIEKCYWNYTPKLSYQLCGWGEDGPWVRAYRYLTRKMEARWVWSCCINKYPNKTLLLIHIIHPVSKLREALFPAVIWSSWWGRTMKNFTFRKGPLKTPYSQSFGNYTYKFAHMPSATTGSWEIQPCNVWEKLLIF